MISLDKPMFGVVDVDRLVEFAKRVPVFPCNKDKRPLVSSGFHAATQDAAQVRAWWKQWPDALVGVPTGQRTSLVVLDYDPHKATPATHAWIAEHTDLLCSTRTHKTARNGLHYLFKSADRYQTGVDLVLDGSPRRGLDLRANGGYVIWWPLHFGGASDTPVAPVPAGLIDERKFNEQRDMAPLPTAAPVEWPAERARVAEALRYVHPDGYEQWIRIGMAIHHASGGSDEGFALWHDWSARGETYDGIQDCRYHWQSFGTYQGRAITLGSLYAKAQDAGYLMHKPPVPPEAAPDTGDLEFRHISTIIAEQREPEWLIDDVLEQNVLAVLAGPRSTFKSFVSLDWGMRTSLTGRPVVILSGEGAGLDRRADAWIKTHAPHMRADQFPVFALERSLNLNQDTDLVRLKGATERLGQVPALVIVDTFSKFSAGLDENDNGEVSTYLARLSLTIRDHYGSTVLLVAHSGHSDAARPRGASALMANPDAEFIITRASPTAMQINVSRERFKDSPALPPLGYEARVVDLGRLDKRGRPVTSLALVPTDAIVTTPKKGVGKNLERALIALREFHRTNPEAAHISSNELADLLAAQGLKDRRRRPEVIAWLVSVGILTPSVGGHAFDPTNL